MEKLNTNCAKNKADYDSRTKSRNEELLAIGETIKILDSDEAFAVSGRALGETAKPGSDEEFLQRTDPVFLQLSAEHRSGSRAHDVFDDELSPLEKAAHVIAENGGSSNADMFLIQTLIRSASSSTEKNDAMKRVQAAIDELVNEMKSQQKQEVKDRDVCLKELDGVDADLRVKSALKEKKTAESEEHAAVVAQLVEQVAALNGNIAEMEKQVAQATADRKEENEVGRFGGWGWSMVFTKDGPVVPN